MLKSEAEVITLLYISKNKYNTIKNTVTLQELVKNTHTNYNTLYKIIQNFINLGYIKEGLSKGKCKTYFISSEGMKLSDEVRKEFKLDV